MEVFLKRSCKLMFKFDVNYRNIETPINSVADMVSYTRQFKHKK